MTTARRYKPHLFKSVVHPGLWACVSSRLSTQPGRAIEPVPYAPVAYGVNPRRAYERWMEYQQCMRNKEAPNVGSA